MATFAAAIMASSSGSSSSGSSNSSTKNTHQQFFIDTETFREDIENCLKAGDRTCKEFYYKIFDDKYKKCTASKRGVDCNPIFQMRELFNINSDIE